MPQHTTDPHKAKAIAELPDFLWLEEDNLPAIMRVLAEADLLQPNELVTAATKAGEGNMNLTLRVTLEKTSSTPRTLIVKQSRPWVEKYPMIAAPTERSAVERAFYQRVQSHEALAERMPRLIGGLATANTTVLQDLGEASDFTDLYQGQKISATELKELMGYLSTLHTRTRGLSDPALTNLPMRRLNHEHIFALPFRANNGVDFEAIEPGLSGVANALHGDTAAISKAEALGKRYLASPQNDDCLLHGDFFPGSWLHTTQGAQIGVWIIDPEFCFIGPPAFDVAITVAHLIMAGADHQVATAIDTYTTQQPGLDLDLMTRFAAVEVLRRNLGVAQLPLTGPQGFRAKLIAAAHRALTTPNHHDALNMLYSAAPDR